MNTYEELNMNSSSRKPNKILHKLISHILFSLDELQSCNPGNSFIAGQKYALVECLQILQALTSPKTLILNFDIENNHPRAEHVVFIFRA